MNQLIGCMISAAVFSIESNASLNALKSILRDLFCTRHSTNANWSLSNNNKHSLAFAFDNDSSFIFSLIFHFSLSISLQSVCRAFQYVFTSACLGFYH